MPPRWFEQEEVALAARRLMAEVVESCKVTSQSERARYSERQLSLLNRKSTLFLIGVLAFIAAVCFAPELMPGEWLAKDQNLHRVVKWLVVIVPIGLGIRAKQRLKRAIARTQGHESCIQKVAADHPTLRNTRHSPIQSESAKIVPFLPTRGRARVHCNLFGEYRGHALAMLESEYQERGNLDAIEALNTLQADFCHDPDREQFSRLRVAEAIVFFRPQLQLPDLFAAGTEEALSAYQSKWVNSLGGQPKNAQVATPLGQRWEVFSSCPQTATPLFTPELTELCLIRPTALVQIIGGFVVVVPRTWSAATPMSTAVQPFEVQLDLDFACAIYEQLEKTFATTAPQANQLAPKLVSTSE